MRFSIKKIILYTKLRVHNNLFYKIESKCVQKVGVEIFNVGN